MSGNEREVENASREMGKMAWEHFDARLARPHHAWRLLVNRKWAESRAVLISEWFDSEAKLQERLEHYAKSDTEIVAVDCYEMTEKLAALRTELAEWKHLAEIRSKGLCELTEQLAEAKAEVERVKGENEKWIDHAARTRKAFERSQERKEFWRRQAVQREEWLGEREQHLAAENAAREAVLRECRVVIEIYREVVDLNDGDVEKFDALLARIAALVAAEEEWK